MAKDRSPRMLPAKITVTGLAAMLGVVCLTLAQNGFSSQETKRGGSREPIAASSIFGIEFGAAGGDESTGRVLRLPTSGINATGNSDAMLDRQPIERIKEVIASGNRSRRSYLALYQKSPQDAIEVAKRELIDAEFEAFPVGAAVIGGLDDEADRQFTEIRLRGLAKRKYDPGLMQEMRRRLDRKVVETDPLILSVAGVPTPRIGMIQVPDVQRLLGRRSLDKFATVGEMKAVLEALIRRPAETSGEAELQGRYLMFAPKRLIADPIGALEHARISPSVVNFALLTHRSKLAPETLRKLKAWTSKNDPDLAEKLSNPQTDARRIDVEQLDRWMRRGAGERVRYAVAEVLNNWQTLPNKDREIVIRAVVEIPGLHAQLARVWQITHGQEPRVDDELRRIGGDPSHPGYIEALRVLNPDEYLARLSTRVHSENAATRVLAGEWITFEDGVRSQTESMLLELSRDPVRSVRWQALINTMQLATDEIFGNRPVTGTTLRILRERSTDEDERISRTSRAMLANYSAIVDTSTLK